MNRAFLIIVMAVAAVGCDGDLKLSKTEVHAPRRAISEGIVYVDMSPAQKLVKIFESEPDPADDAQDLVSCKKAGGEWADYYVLGVLFLREPQEGAVRDGKMCWSTRQPEKLADAGKLCSGPADCIGNCIAEQQSDGKWHGPRCQTYAGPVCGPLYDGGEYHWIDCPIH